MYQRDFVMKMIEMIADLIAGILGLIKKGDYSEASQALDNAYHDMLKQDASFFRNIPIDELTDKLLQEHNYTNGHLEILSELFYAQAELFYAQNKSDESLEYYEKGLKLFHFIIKETKVFSIEKQDKISKMESRIAELT